MAEARIMSYDYDSDCPWCGSYNPEDNMYCNTCGGAIAPILCNQCLASNAPTASFCGKCGEMLQYTEYVIEEEY